MRLTRKLSIPSTAKVLLLKIQTCYMNMTVSGWALCILEVDVSLCDTVGMSDFFFRNCVSSLTYSFENRKVPCPQNH